MAYILAILPVLMRFVILCSSSYSNRKSLPVMGEACCGLVTLLRFERRTYCLEGSCSIQLSYGAILDFEL